MPQITSAVQNVIAPPWVYDAEGNYLNGLRGDQFHLYDHSTGPNVKWDEAFEPILVVILPQANSAVDHTLPTVSKIGNLIGPMITSDRVQVAVIRLRPTPAPAAGVHRRSG